MLLGWHISVYRQQNGGTTPASAGAPHGARLAVWQTGLGGLDWLNDLVTHEKAISLGGNGYPIEYTATADHIIPRPHADPPAAKAMWTFDEGDVILPGWLGKTTKDVEAINGCRPDEWLLIEAWDES